MLKLWGAVGAGFPGTHPAGSHPRPCPLLWVKDTAKKSLHRRQDTALSLSCLHQTLSQPSGMQSPQPHPFCPSLQGSAAFLGEHRHRDERGCATGLGWWDTSWAGCTSPRNPLYTTRRVRGCQPQLCWGKHPDFHPNPCREEVCKLPPTSCHSQHTPCPQTTLQLPFQSVTHHAACSQGTDPANGPCCPWHVRSVQRNGGTPL